MKVVQGIAFVVATVAAAAACSAIQPNLLGGRERCWDQQRDPRAAALLEGTLELSADGSALDTGDARFELSFPSLAVRTDAESGRVAIIGSDGLALATDGERVTLFGGMGGDGFFAVCAVEERHDG